VTRALVVGSGPNGLGAAIVLAQAGLDVTVAEANETVGGGTRSAELTLPGVVHDVCSAVHPFAVASPFLRTLPLDDHGLSWALPEVQVAQPLVSGDAGVIYQSIDETAASMGVDKGRWHQLFDPLVTHFDDIADDALGPVLSLPGHPISFGRFGLRAALPATALSRLFRTDAARAALAGNFAHVMRPLNRPLTSSVGLMLTAVAHRHGWPVAVGGSAAITTAMASYLTSLGGRIETGSPVTNPADLSSYDVVMLNLAPARIVEHFGALVDERVLRSLDSWKPGFGAFKIDLAIEGDIPWQAEACRRAGTVHVGGTAEDVAAAETEVHHGRMPERPFVLVGQQYLCDPSRSSASANPIWMYAHVPAGYAGDATEAILEQVERFAPGFRDRILATETMAPADFEAYNANYVAGDILTGANSVRQMVFRPGVRPYWLNDGLYLCSAAAPPGAGVHGMSGYHAANKALAAL